MPTAAIYTLLPLAKRLAGETADGAWFAVGRRTNWTVIIRSAVDATLTVTIEAAADGSEAASRRTVSTTSLTTKGKTTLLSKGNTPELDIAEYETHVRARITSATTDSFIEVVASAPFLDFTESDDMEYLPRKELRDFSQVDEVIEQAERDVIDEIGVGAHGVLDDVDLTDPDWPDRIKRAVAQQVIHIDQRIALERANEVAKEKAARSMPRLSPLAEAIIDHGRAQGAHLVWRGR